VETQAIDKVWAKLTQLVHGELVEDLTINGLSEGPIKPVLGLSRECLAEASMHLFDGVSTSDETTVLGRGRHK
jgi:hypothetical protein